VRNEQSTGAEGSGSARIGDGEQGVLVGVSQALYGQGTALHGATAGIAGNSLAAQASGNTASNVLNVAATQPTASFFGGPAYSVLNNQSNAAALQAAVSYSFVGLNAAAAALQGTAASVSGNQVLAAGTGNSASNVVGLGTQSLQGTQGGGATVSSVQSNGASINAAVRGVQIGVVGGYVAGSAGTVQGNSVSAQAVGNTARNVISAK
jgi:hypothetical protein